MVPQAPARPLAMGKGGIAQVVQNKAVPPLTEEANHNPPVAPPNVPAGIPV